VPGSTLLPFESFTVIADELPPAIDGGLKLIEVSEGPPHAERATFELNPFDGWTVTWAVRLELLAPTPDEGSRDKLNEAGVVAA
jgi:hypothetical protein